MDKYLFTIAVFLFAANASGAGLLGFSPTPAELKLLPDYCKANAAGPSSPEYKSWAARLGRPYSGFHHYCSGVNQINRYWRLANDPKRNYYLSRAVPEINYVLDKIPADFPLAGEMYLNRAIAKQLMRQDGAAITDFNLAISHDPNQVKAYLGLADIYEKLNKKQKALDSVADGVKQIPTSKALKRRYIELGGKEPFPVAELQSVPEEKPAPASAVSSGEGEATASPQDLVPGSVDAPSSTNPGNEEKTMNELKKPEIGSPSNPYCRFCP